MTLDEMISKTDKRKAGFTLMMEHLDKFENPFIVETGSIRPESTYEGDGMSTLIFDTYANQKGGKVFSVDIDPINSGFARQQTTMTNVITGDSVKTLYDMQKHWVTDDETIHLLYLDSYDFDIKNPHPSSLHHLMELTAVMPALKPGSTMIVVDDNVLAIKDGDATKRVIEIGKGFYIKYFMELIGKPRLYNGYQWVWVL